MTDDVIHRPEFDQFRGDVTRRLDGHDSLYSDLRQTREELVAFTETLKHARQEISSGLTDRVKCRAECVEHRAGFDGRIRSLERFRWQIGGALILIAAVPSWTAVILLLAGR